MKGNTRTFLGILLAFLILAGMTQLFTWESPPQSGPLPVHLSDLPGYAVASLLRMTAAFFLSLAFSLPYGYYAATRPAAGKVLIPVLDILQSVPVLGFFPAAVYFFVALAGGRRLGVEMASVFLIFTGQAWNMAFGVYESCSTIPVELREAVVSLGLRPGAVYRTLYLPFSIPRLIYNSVMSWAGGWYFLIACEIITVGPATFNLPGLGYFLSQSAEQGRVGYLFLGLGVLLGFVAGMDFFVWRPLSTWSGRFRYEMSASSLERIIGQERKPLRGGRLVRQARLFLRRGLGRAWHRLRFSVEGAFLGLQRFGRPAGRLLRRLAGATGWTLLLGMGGLLAYGAYRLSILLAWPWPQEAVHLPAAMGFSFLRMATAYLISLGWTLPVAVWAGENRRVMNVVRPLAEIGASLPATALFPLMVYFIIRHAGGMNTASVLLILTGMQWYLLFNLLSGVDSIPQELKEAVRSLGLSRWQTFRRLTLPAVLPALITGSVTGWGGGWNALIVSEYFKFAGKVHTVTGIGAFLDRATYELGDMRLMALSLLTMVLVIVGVNHFFWRRLYAFAADRFRLEL
ncbi:MAG: ABC transporter permease subunit [Acidobacteriota bacterium]